MVYSIKQETESIESSLYGGEEDALGDYGFLIRRIRWRKCHHSVGPSASGSRFTTTSDCTMLLSESQLLNRTAEMWYQAKGRTT